MFLISIKWTRLMISSCQPLPTTPMPTPAPTDEPTNLPTPNPTSLAPSISPSKTPSTDQPTINMDDVTVTANVLDVDSLISPFGCSNSPSFKAVDGTTRKYVCQKSGLGIATGFEARPSHGQMSVVQKLRVYGKQKSVPTWTRRLPLISLPV